MIGVAVRALSFGPPWIDVSAGRGALASSLHVAGVLVASAVYVRTTPIAETQAAIARLVPGKPGRVTAAGTSFNLRFLPVLLDDLSPARLVQRARLGDARPLHEWLQTIPTSGLNRAFEQSDRFSLALKARCFAWNPTPPSMQFTIADRLVIVAAILLLALRVSATF